MNDTLICITCGTIYNKDRIKHAFDNIYLCPNSQNSCGNSLIEVDENLSEIILKLWKLGLPTWSSCEGHPNKLSVPYIYFCFKNIEDCKDARHNLHLYNDINDHIFKIQEPKSKNIFPPAMWWVKDLHTYETFRLTIKEEKDIRELSNVEKLKLKYEFIKHLYNFVEWAEKGYQQ